MTDRDYFLFLVKYMARDGIGTYSENIRPFDPKLAEMLDGFNAQVIEYLRNKMEK